jgi:hypothetical protein
LEKPDFAALRAKRDANIKKAVEDFCRENGLDPETAAVHVSGAHGCYCACPDGPCEHQFDGWREFDGGRGGEKVCNLCGMGAMGHSLRCGP